MRRDRHSELRYLLADKVTEMWDALVRDVLTSDMHRCHSRWSALERGMFAHLIHSSRWLSLDGSCLHDHVMKVGTLTNLVTHLAQRGRLSHRDCERAACHASSTITHKPLTAEPFTTRIIPCCRLSLITNPRSQRCADPLHLSFGSRRHNLKLMNICEIQHE